MISINSKLNNSGILKDKSLYRNIVFISMFGIGLSGLLCYVLGTQFYFYQIVLAGLFLLPIAGLAFLYFPRRSLFAALMITIPFNPSFHLVRFEEMGSVSGIMLRASDVIVLLIFLYLFFNKLLGNKHSGISLSNIWYLGLPLVLWIVIGFLSIIPASNKNIVIFELIRMIKVLFYFVAAFLLVKKFNNIRFIMVCLLASLALQTFLVFAEFGLNKPLFRLPGERREADAGDRTGEVIRPGGTMGHSGNFAKLTSLCLPICFSLIFAVRKNIWRIIFAGLLISSLVALVLTVSRAGIGTSLIGLFLVPLVLSKNVKNKQIFVFGSIVILVISIGFSWLLGGDRLSDRMSDDGGSAQSRLPMFSVAWNVIRANPLMGVGLNNYTLIAPEYDQTPEKISVTYQHPVHNIYMLSAAEIGIPGTIVFLWFLFATILLTFRQSKLAIPKADIIIVKAIGIGIFCSWIQGLVDWGFRSSSVHISYLAILAGLLSALMYVKTNQNKANVIQRSNI